MAFFWPDKNIPNATFPMGSLITDGFQGIFIFDLGLKDSGKTRPRERHFFNESVFSLPVKAARIEPLILGL
jgi:hypothetical protein